MFSIIIVVVVAVFFYYDYFFFENKGKIADSFSQIIYGYSLYLAHSVLFSAVLESIGSPQLSTQH